MTDNLRHLEYKYCSQGDTSSKRKDKKFFSGAKGHFLLDQDGHKYLDFQMFNSAANFGYQSTGHIETLKNQIQQLPALSSEFIHNERVMLAENICRSIEDRFGLKGRVHFSVGGAQAIDTALMILASFKGSRRIFAFEGGYHGRTIAATEVSASYRYRSIFSGTAQAAFIPFPYCYRCPYSKEFSTCNYYCILQFERLFSSTAFGITNNAGECELKGFLAEPILGRGGYVPTPPKYFKRLKTILDKFNLIFIADEVQMAFYRAGKLWAFENYGISPDIIVFGKSITNGMYPLSGIWARNPLLDDANWPTSSAQATFGGAPLGAALGNATFSLINHPNFEREVRKRGDKIEIILNNLATRFSIIGHINRVGMAFSLDIENRGNPDPLIANSLVERGLQGHIGKTKDGLNFGLVMTCGGLYDNMIMLAPPILISDEEIILFGKLIHHLFNIICN